VSHLCRFVGTSIDVARDPLAQFMLTVANFRLRDFATEKAQGSGSLTVTPPWQGRTTPAEREGSSCLSHHDRGSSPSSICAQTKIRNLDTYAVAPDSTFLGGGPDPLTPGASH